MTSASKTNGNLSRSVDDEQRHLAVLIDADNAQPSVIEGLLAEVAKFGVASVKRIYGDFTSPQLTRWKKALLKHSISPVQQFAYTSGKNATDSMLIIDAMDLMYTRRFDGFCLVSSDSDFTRLAQRLREEGLTVYGFGERKTPDPFVQACDKFIYTEVLRAETPASEKATPSAGKSATATAVSSPAKAAKATKPGKKTATATTEAAAEPPVSAGPLPPPLALIRQAIEDASDELGWANLAPVGSYLTKVRPDFDARLYGYRKLSDLLKSQPKYFAVEERTAPGSSGKALFVRVVG
ncbi:MAG: hypothetical protein CVV14_14710 [Gammaproteobacteria bacterium HGW-Gammaproteobacteria-4]|jgi:uncharacterized LabA/DUF88 family protein|nr:MAG: hypothetical protein CVV14_14710 [Gammaproteobacteria bacterium HGW-Gammaproteobacteria-4]